MTCSHMTSSHLCLSLTILGTWYLVTALRYGSTSQSSYIYNILLVPTSHVQLFQVYLLLVHLVLSQLNILTLKYHILLFIIVSLVKQNIII